MTASTTLILGGGFGGLTAANTLRVLLPPEHEIVVIDAAPRFHVGAGKTWVMLGDKTYEQISQDRKALLAAGVRLVPASVEAIDLAARTVRAGGRSIVWNHLVVALGADLDLGVVPGLAEAAHTFYTVEGAQRLKGTLERFEGGDLVTLIPKVPFKCPPAPYEAAMLLHDAFVGRGLRARVRLAVRTFEPTPMATAGPEMGQFIKAQLAERDIAFTPQRVTARVDGARRRIVDDDGTETPFDLLIAVPPHVPPKVVRDAGLAGPSGWIPVDPKTMAVTQPAGLENVYAVGDVTAVPLPGRFKPDVGLMLPKAGVFAEAHGRVAAHGIAAKVLGRASAAEFDGRGFCFLETGGGRAVRAEGAFFELPHPVMQKREPDEEQLRFKHDWVEGFLRAR